MDNDDTKYNDDICLPSALMQDCVKTSNWHILRDHHLGWIGILPYWESWKEPFFIIDSSSLSPIITIIIATHQIWRWVTASKDWQHVRVRKDSELKLKFYHQKQIRPRSWGYFIQAHRGWIFTLGYSSLKSLEILGVHSRRARIFAAISFPCKRKHHQSH